MTLEDLFEDAKTRERPKPSSGTVTQQEEDQIPVVRNLHKLILEGKMAFDEGNFEFEIEIPNQEELDSQLALLNHRLKVDLPNGSHYDEPVSANEGMEGEEVPEIIITEKLESGFGYYAYTSSDREGTGVTYIGEWLN